MTKMQEITQANIKATRAVARTEVAEPAEGSAGRNLQEMQAPKQGYHN